MRDESLQLLQSAHMGLLQAAYGALGLLWWKWTLLIFQSWKTGKILSNSALHSASSSVFCAVSPHIVPGFSRLSVRTEAAQSTDWGTNAAGLGCIPNSATDLLCKPEWVISFCVVRLAAAPVCLDCKLFLWGAACAVYPACPVSKWAQVWCHQQKDPCKHRMRGCSVSILISLLACFFFFLIEASAQVLPQWDTLDKALACWDWGGWGCTQISLKKEKKKTNKTIRWKRLLIYGHFIRI